MSGGSEAGTAAEAVYRVVPNADGWAIEFAGRRFGHETLSAAVAAALKAARTSAAAGHRAHVLTQNRKRRMVARLGFGRGASRLIRHRGALC